MPTPTIADERPPVLEDFNWLGTRAVDGEVYHLFYRPELESLRILSARELERGPYQMMWTFVRTFEMADAEETLTQRRERMYGRSLDLYPLRALLALARCGMARAWARGYTERCYA